MNDPIFLFVDVLNHAGYRHGMSDVHFGENKTGKNMYKSLKISVLAAVVTTSVLTGCATSEKIQVTQMGDDSLSCGAIQAEMAKLDASKANIDSKKGVTGTNVAAALFWLPGLAYTYYDAGQAEKLITDRKSALTQRFNSKKCVV